MAPLLPAVMLLVFGTNLQGVLPLTEVRMACDVPGWLSLVGERPRGQVGQRRVRRSSWWILHSLIQDAFSHFIRSRALNTSIEALSAGVPGQEKSISALFKHRQRRVVDEKPDRRP